MVLFALICLIPLLFEIVSVYVAAFSKVYPESFFIAKNPTAGAPPLILCVAESISNYLNCTYFSVASVNNLPSISPGLSYAIL
jgi:hypothetical protein